MVTLHRAYNAARELAEILLGIGLSTFGTGRHVVVFTATSTRLYRQSPKMEPCRCRAVYFIWASAFTGRGIRSGRKSLYDRIKSLGSPPILVHPYLAELAFLQQDYAAVRKWMQHTHQENRMPRLHQTLTYWV